MKITLYIIIVLFVLWSVYGYFGSRVEQVTYSVIKKTKEYEMRNYPAHIVAQTTVSGTYEESLNKGFTIVAGYIFGGNIKKEKIAMTAPVVSKEIISEKIAMTAPVLVNTSGEDRTISFGMPRSYTLESLPTPTDPRVKIVEVPEKKYAAMRFSGYRTNGRVENIEKILLEALAIDKIEVVGKPSYAGYNAPWTPPWMIRNEVLVEVK
jgi:effector-binding domain-containing protein